ncbi:MAG: anhydro-N-acetylmuramic acid kinase [Bacteroidota bacterium]|nr:anhydro-N-acetylmuramic acid kinase [Bacteroidota bacterium]
MLQKKYRAIGLMSGTSLDGLDIALCDFYFFNKNWSFKIEKGKTFDYSKYWKSQLENAPNLNGFELTALHVNFGKLIADRILEFIDLQNEEIDLIASHGHTVFHNPSEGINLQIGKAEVIATHTGITTISDFRSLDISLGGQGAPLVPIGDELLFTKYDFCLNLGGFANISFTKNNKRIAFDICPVNILINHYVKKFKLNSIGYDKNGEIAQQGAVNNKLLLELNSIKFYKKLPPKSLGKEWLEKEVIPIINNFNLKTEDLLRTIYEHVAIQIFNVVKNNSGKSLLITGGGTYNNFLIKLIKQKIDSQKKKVEITIPNKEIIDFKEALIFAFLGVLKRRNEINCLASVTGAKHDNCGGKIVELIEAPLYSHHPIIAFATKRGSGGKE